MQNLEIGNITPLHLFDNLRSSFLPESAPDPNLINFRFPLIQMNKILIIETGDFWTNERVVEFDFVFLLI